MLDILQLRVNQEEIEQLHSCQMRRRGDGQAVFTVEGPGTIWPLASWDAPVVGRINVRGWFPLLDTIADEFLLWWPQGGCIFVSGEEATYRRHESDTTGVLFLALEVNRLHLVSAQMPRSRTPTRWQDSFRTEG
jgi:hypothetical protein